MASLSRPIVIGAGHNGLTTAFYLAKAGLRPMVFERRSMVGGAAITERIAPGVHCPSLAHTIGPLRPSIARDMQLERRGVEFVRPDPRLIAFAANGSVLTFSIDHARTAASIRVFSPKDADRYPEFCATFARLGRFLSRLLAMAPPSLETPGARDIWESLASSARLRLLGKQTVYRLLRWAPMAAADFVSEWFESEPLQAAIAARGIFGTAQGPWSAGTAALILLQAGLDSAPEGSSVMVKGGPGALTAAMAHAVEEAGGEIRLGQPVSQVLVRDGTVEGVVLQDGTEIAATAVVSNADPRRTFLELVDPTELDPVFVTRVRNYRCVGRAAKINLVIGEIPVFPAVANERDLGGRLHIGPTVDYLERAFDASKYGDMSSDPYLDVTMPTLLDGSLVPAGKHLLSICVHFAPYQLRDGRPWSGAERDLLSRVMTTLEAHAPGIRSLVEYVQVITPDQLEREYALTGGQIYHGEPSLDQLFMMRPVLGCARYRTPIAGLYLCGAGAHPGGGITGGAGQNAAREILRALR